MKPFVQFNTADDFVAEAELEYPRLSERFTRGESGKPLARVTTLRMASQSLAGLYHWFAVAGYLNAAEQLVELSLYVGDGFNNDNRKVIDTLNAQCTALEERLKGLGFDVRGGRFAFRQGGER